MDDVLLVRLRAQVAAQHMLLLALIDSHPDRSLLAQKIAHFAQNTRDLQLGYPIPDNEIETAQHLIEVYRALAAI